MAALSIVTPPAVEPVALDDAKAHLRVSATDEDSYIASLIVAARTMVENATRRSLITRTLRLRIDDFCHGFREHGIELPLGPVASISSFTYVDAAGTPTAVPAVYTLEVDTEPAWVRLSYGATWPTPRPEPLVVTIDYVAGYGATPAAVPVPLAHAIRLYLSHLYEHREPVAMGLRAMMVPESAAALMAPYVLPVIG